MGENNYKERQHPTIKMKLKNGKTVQVDRTKIMFNMIPSRLNKNLINASDRSYKMGDDGSLRRLNSKETKAERKARKRENRGKK